MVNKQPVFSWFLDNGDVMVSIDTGFTGVDVPVQLRTGEVASFIFGAVPTPHMAFDDWGISSPMRFSGNLYTCRFPWGSIQQLSSEDAVIQFRQGAGVNDGQQSASGGAKTSPEPEKKGRGKLRLIK